jgi:hypothetical protein
VQSKRMDVADKYFDGMMKMLEQVKSTTDRGSENQDKILEEIGKLKTQNDKQDSLMTDIVAYLNGDFQNYVSQHHKGEAKRR